MEPLADRHRRGRRDLLKLGAAAGVGWLTGVAEALAQQTEEKSAGGEQPRPKSIIWLWLEGGPSQLETFDPHPGTNIAGGTKAISTSVPQMQLAEGFERTADVAHHLSLVRSIVTKEGDHARGAYLAKTGYRPEPTAVHPSIGAICCHEFPVGGTEVPRHVSILSSQHSGRGGFLGTEFDAFQMGDPAKPVPDIASPVKAKRRDERLADIALLDRQFSGRREALFDADVPKQTLSAARRIMTSEQLAAFDVNEEPAAVHERFGDTALGRGCLAARRLIEVGVRCVEVNLTGWDTHVENHRFHRSLVETLDPALAGLITDLAERDLLDKTIVVCAGEFGRTPRINSVDGRDHWTNGFSVALAGGRLNPGLVVGETDPEGGKQVANPHAYGDVHATLLSALGINPEKENLSRIGRPIKLSEGKVIGELLG